MPGYDSQVVMAAGAFTLGSSIELSADAPIRPPYYAWIKAVCNSIPPRSVRNWQPSKCKKDS